ncbi:MAG: radical SAM protein, partial [Lachnospiraceae bacterium]|nr:radical SAM protein [Lachnospiraceae bacterium]
MRENTVETLRQKEYIDRLRVLYSEKAKALGRPCTYHIETFGCQMNAKDSEKFAGILQKAGCMPASEDEADFVLYNTCTVRENANLKVYGHLGKLRHEKKSGRNGLKIALCGCMMQEPDEIEKILKEHSFVDLIFGTHNIHRFAELVYRMETGNGPVVEVWPEAKEIVEDLPSERKYRFKAGVNIMFGCNNFCSYCIVPYVRGRERSREASEVLSEIERLSKEGVREVMLLGQNVNSYGNTLEEKVSFAELLKRT